MELDTKFENLSKFGICNEISEFIESNKFDISADDNFYIELMATRGDVKLLQLIKQHNGNLHYDDETLLCIVSLHGFVDCRDYLVKDCKEEEWKIVYKTNAYNNNTKTKLYFDNLSKS